MSSDTPIDGAETSSNRLPLALQQPRWLVICGAICILFLLSLFAYSFLKNQEWRATKSKALAVVLDGSPSEAKAAVDRLAFRYPDRSEIDYWNALLAVRQDQPSVAIEAIRKAMERGYDPEPLLVLRAILLSRADQYVEAETTLRKAFEADAIPRKEIAEALARVYLKTFQPARLTSVLDRWMQLAPDDPTPYLWRIEVNQRLARDVEPLILDYREALRRAPELDDARLALADRLREASKLDEATAEYAILLNLDPKNAKANIGVARIAMLKGDPPSAIKHLENAIEADPRSSVALRELALIDLRYNRFEKACDRLKKAVELEPSDPEVRFSYVQALTAAGRKDLAAKETVNAERLRKEQKEISDLREKLSERPNDLDLRSKIARYLIEHGHAKEGLEWTALILRANPRHLETCRLLAEYHAKNGNAALANYYKLLVPPR